MTHKERYELYKSLRDQGKTYQEIADILGVKREGVKKYCEHHNLSYSKEEFRLSRVRNATIYDAHSWDLKIKARYGEDFKLVSFGDTNEDGARALTIRCSKCGTEKTISSITLRVKSVSSCQVCERKARQVQKQLEKQAEKIKKEKKQTKKKVKVKQIEIRFCECGNVLPAHKRLCPECAEKRKREQQKAQWSLSEVKRRSRLQKVKHDSDLTLEKLYERDKGICHLCGGLCDWNDYHIINGQKQADNQYPSIDHLIVVSKGGTHTWDNVKLAHRICNTKRGTKPIPPPCEKAS